MMSEQQVAKELMVRGWGFGHFEELGKIDAGLKKLGIPPSQVVQLVEATDELKGADFRAAAFSLLELKKRTGKSYKEAEVYIQSLGVEITSNEKQNSDWIAKAEKAKGELRDWERKRSDERAKFSSEQARNKRILKEDEEKLKLELQQSNEIRANIEETIELKADLKKISMDLSMFKSIVREMVLKGGISPQIGKDIKTALATFVSLGKAIAERAREEKAKKKAILNLSRQEKEKREAFSREERERKELLRVLDKSNGLKHEKGAELSQLLDSRRKLLLKFAEEIEKKKWQWEFFELFISMLLGSPSKTDSLAELGSKLQELNKTGWRHIGVLTLPEPEQRRALFILFVMGTYLHSMHCSQCKARFIVNKPPNAYHRYQDSYECPVCHFWFYTKPDDTFLNLMVSPELAQKLQDVRALLDTMEKSDMEAFKGKLKLLGSIPDEVFEAFSAGHKVQVKVLDGAD